MKSSLVFFIIILSIHLWSTIGFVVNSGSETLSRIDFETGQVDNVFSVLGSMPNRVELTQEFAYVVNSGDNNVQKINLQNGATEELIFIGLSTNPYDIVSADDFAYVSGGLSNKIYKIDLTIDEMVGSLSVGSNPAGMVVLGDKLYVGNTDYANFYANCSVSIIDLNSLSTTATIPTEVNPQFLAVINGKIHISCGGDWGSIGGKICVLDPDTEEITDIIEIGGVTYNMAITPNDVVYVSDGFGYSLFAYDALDYSIIYSGTNPFTPGGTMIASNQENLFVLGGEWGQNFTVKKYDFAENLIDEYAVALYATDIKLMPENTSVTQNTIHNTQYNLTNYPNPFNPSTTISFQLITEISENTEIDVYSLKGQKVKQLLSDQLSAGQHTVVWNGTDEMGKKVSSGIYLYKMEAGKFVSIKKMILTK